MLILIAEDDITSRVMLAGILKKSGYEVIEAVNGLEALKLLQREDAPQLAILDWIMPEMDGIEVVHRIRAIQTNRPPYIIMLTAKSEKVDIITGLDAGSNDYLPKPFDIGELRSRIEVGRRMIEMQDELVKSKEALEYQATHDDLTGMLNRRAILDLLSKELARARRFGHVLAIGMCDIDHFKKINDLYGHQTGNEVLCGLAKILMENLRVYDSAGRVGGEEFLIIIPLDEINEFPTAFNRLCMKIAESKIITRSGSISITVSIGTALSSKEITVDQMLIESDSALYRAKSEGRNCVKHSNRK
jgi:two-component system, cell cycle response regulator